MIRCSPYRLIYISWQLCSFNDLLRCPGAILVNANRCEMRRNNLSHLGLCCFWASLKQSLDNSVANIVWKMYASNQIWTLTISLLYSGCLPLHSSTISSRHSIAIVSSSVVATYAPVSSRLRISRRREISTFRFWPSSGAAGIWE